MNHPSLPPRRARLACLLAALVLPATAVFAQTQLYWAGGTADIANGTALPTDYASLSGTWDTSTQNWATDSSGTTYQAWEDGSVFNGSFSFTSSNQISTITLADDVSVAGINATISVSGGYNQYALFTAASDTNIALTGDSPVINVQAPGTSNGTTTAALEFGGSVHLTGDNGFTKTGNDLLDIQNSNDDLTGTINLTQTLSGTSAGTLKVGVGGSLLGITQFNVSGKDLSVQDTDTFLLQTSQSNVNMLNDDAVINLGGMGVFSYIYAGGSATTETIGALRLSSSGMLDLSGTNTLGTLLFTDGIERATDTAQLIVKVKSGQTPLINIGTSSGFATGVALPWATDTEGRFFEVDSDGNLLPVTSTDVAYADAGSSFTDPTANYRITGTSAGTAASLPSGAVANTLGIYPGGSGSSFTLTIADTLTLTSGGLAFGNDNANQGVTIAGGSLTSGSGVLYLSTGSSSAGGALTISSQITGDIDLAKTGNQPVILSGSSPNTYTGVTYVNGGQLTLQKSNGVVSVPGDVVIANGGTLNLSSSGQLATTSNVTVQQGGTFYAGDASTTINSISGAGIVISHNGASGKTIVNGFVTPGDNGGIGTLITEHSSTGTSNQSQLVMASGAVFNFTLAGDGSAASQMAFYDFNTTGQAGLNDELVLNNNAVNLSLVGNQVAGTYTVSLFKFYSDAGSTVVASGITDGLTIGTLGDGITDAFLTYNADSIDLTYTVASAIPEPSACALLFGVAILGLGVLRRHRRRNS